MILSYIDNFEQEKDLYPLALQRALAYLKNTDFTQLANGKYTIDGDKLKAIVSEYTPDIKENRKAETHNQYVDVQYIHVGEEYIGFSRLTAAAVSADGYLPDKDATFYQSFENEIALKVETGMYAVFFPWDIHRPGCVSQPGVKVGKVVVKVKLDEILAK